MVNLVSLYLLRRKYKQFCFVILFSICSWPVFLFKQLSIKVLWFMILGEKYLGYSLSLGQFSWVGTVFLGTICPTGSYVQLCRRQIIRKAIFLGGNFQGLLSGGNYPWSNFSGNNNPGAIIQGCNYTGTIFLESNYPQGQLSGRQQYRRQFCGGGGNFSRG